MAYLPIFLSLAGRTCVVIGGGEVGQEKVVALLDAKADVRVISPNLTPALRQLVQAGRTEHFAREWQPGDLRGCTLAFAAVDDPQLHRAIKDEARSLGVLLNVPDHPEFCDFISSAVVHRGELQIAISTSGASPALASRIRRELEAVYGPEYETVVEILRAARSWLRDHVPDSERRAQILRALAVSDLADLIRDAQWPEVDGLLVSSLGVHMSDLGISPGSAGRRSERVA